jgi:epoxyqueuosine reductase
MVRLDDEKAAKAAFSFFRRHLADPAGPGLSAWAFLGEAGLRSATSSLPEEVGARYGLAPARSALVAALAYSEGPAEMPPWAEAWTRERAASRPGAGSAPIARIARFARADWYKEIIARLSGLAALVRSDLAGAGFEAGSLPEWRCLANSRLPERPMALLAGLGVQGRNCLLIVRRPGGPEAAGSASASCAASALPIGPGSARPVGPGAVLGVLLLPFAIPEDELEPASLPVFGSACGSCQACIEACPTGALSLKAEGPGFTRELCLQHWSAIDGALPLAVEARWGQRLYGCDACLEACPHFHADPLARTERGLLGPGLPAEWLAGASDAEIRAKLSGTALGLGWMKPAAFRRNARLAMGDSAAGAGDAGRDPTI